MADTYRCDQCGLCCRQKIIEAQWYDVIREPRIEERCPLPANKPVSLKVIESTWVLNSRGAKDMACTFLGDDNRCTIYATRPTICVAFAAGSETCQELRRNNGLSPLLAVPASGVVDEAYGEAAVFQSEED